jgi:ribosomal subunit interface protein
MEIEVHGRRVEVPDDLRESAIRKTERLSRYLAGMERAEVWFSDGHVGRLGDPVTCEVMLEGHGHVVRAVGVGGRPGVALDAAMNKAGVRLTRLKKKLVDRSRPRHAHINGKLVPPMPQGEPPITGEEAVEASDGDEGDEDLEGITEL